MIFPNLALWNSRDPNDPASRIDRAITDRNQRLSAGLSVSNRFDKVRGALVLSQGNGKFLRIRHIVHAEEEIPKPIRDGLLELRTTERIDLPNASQLLADLADVQAQTVERLKREAGKYVDRVLAVAVCDPGLWRSDFDGRMIYSAMCDPTRLAEVAGVSVIDAFPARDLAVGGSGKLLEALPLWLMFADREEPKSERNRIVLTVRNHATGYLLPCSDGLDAELPPVQSFSSCGFEFLNVLIRNHFPSNPKGSVLDALYADGKNISQLAETWSELERELKFQFSNSSLGDSYRNKLAEQLIESTESFLNENHDSLSSVIRTGVQWIADRLVTDIESLASRISPHPCGHIIVDCSAQYEACLINRLTQQVETKVDSIRQFGFQQGDIQAVIAAVTGLCHIDQLPVNIPWLTGADSQRILGRLTPGRPSNWRQLVRAMADFHPAPMKLRDAV